MGVSTGLLLWSRFHLMGTGPPQFQAVDNPASYAESILTRVSEFQRCKASLLMDLQLNHMNQVSVSTCSCQYTCSCSVWQH